MMQKIQTIVKEWNLQLSILNIIFFLFTFSILTNFANQLFFQYGYESWQISEWLINYQGGYVRRGLIGEILFFFARNFNFDVEWAIKIFCAFSFLAVCFFFIRQFLKKGYVLYILPLCFFMGTHFLNGMYWQKRDYAIFILFIAALWIHTKSRNLILQLVGLNALMALAMQVHEAIAFFTLPFLFILLMSKYKHKGFIVAGLLSLLSLSPSIGSFLLTIRYHGDMHTAQNIWDSWVQIRNLTPATVGEWSHGTLSSIGWERTRTFEMHYNKNVWSVDYGVVSITYWTMIVPIIYYITTNVLLVFKRKDNIFTVNDRTLLSSILIFQFICLIPFFLRLSCDLGRILFYWVASSFVIFLLVPKSSLENIFPKFYYQSVVWFNKYLERIVRPSKTSVAFLMLFIGVPTAGFLFEHVIDSNVIKNVLNTLSNIVLKFQ